MNTGEAAWTRAAGHCLRLLGGHQWELLPQEEVIPGQAREFSVLWPAPDSYGFYEIALQMCQQGGVGRFGEVARGVVSVTSFLDVPADNWAVSAIEAVKDAGIVRGYGGDLYRPEWAVTRDQMAVYVARGLAGGDSAVPSGPAVPTFGDVPAGHWAYKYVEYTAANEVVQGYWDGYRPDEVVDRAQMAAFMARAMAGGESGVPDSGCVTPPFPDVPCDFWARKYVEYLKSAEVVGGYPDGLYHPEAICTRDQMAVYVAGAFDLQMEAGAQGEMKDVALRPAASFSEKEALAYSSSSMACRISSARRRSTSS